MSARRIHVTGVVQGVGFRPYVWTLAHRHALRGWVRNSSSGVDIAVEGAADDVARFLDDLRAEGPPLARIDAVTDAPAEPEGAGGFEILASRPEPNAALPVSADLATCDDCLAELRGAGDRRYRYPFINCTNCGPRYTIIRDMPYDRARTTMSTFALCADCRREYEDPADRRFHAQPVACPACGPRVWIEVAGRRGAERDAAIVAARERLARGEILAVKGIGGFHLACDATNPDAVARLRARKHREEKPLALMAADLGTVRRHAVVAEAARSWLESVARPVVLLPARGATGIADEVAPGRREHGFMLPYTPLHHLLLEPAGDVPDVLVMTSANRTDEPIVHRNDDARERLGAIADAFLVHDRPIHVRADDSVIAVPRGRPCLFRRARGIAPLPVRLPFAGPSVLALGGDLKNTFCLTRRERAYLGPHIGDLVHLDNLRALDAAIAHYERLFRVRPELIVHDRHPDYASTRVALERAGRDGIPAVAVQHHHAHVASCMAEHGLERAARVIGVSFDGTGYGTDGTIWGGEFLVAGYRDFERHGRLRPVPLPGGDAAIRHPHRVALSWLREAGVAWTPDLAPVRAAGDGDLALIESQIRAGVNVPRTSSVGRLFDAVSSLLGLCQVASYEAQAASELESVAARDEPGAYPFPVADGTVDPAPAIRSIVADLRCGVAVPIVAGRFHRGLARMTSEVCRGLRSAHGSSRGSSRGLSYVVLSGGVWQNRLLLELSVAQLEADGFDVLLHEQVPANDGGLALGQAVVAMAIASAGAENGASREPARRSEES